MPCKGKVFAVCLLGLKNQEQKLSFLHATLLLDLIYVPTKNYQIISISEGVMA